MRGSLTGLFFIVLLSFVSTAFADEEITTTTTKPNATGGTTTTIVRKTIVTTAPSPKTTVTIPPNFVNCFEVNAGWFNDVWVTAHRVCQYVNSPNGLAWVDGYWQCDKYTLETGVCTSWDWVKAHWVTSYNVY